MNWSCIFLALPCKKNTQFAVTLGELTSNDPTELALVSEEKLNVGALINNGYNTAIFGTLTYESMRLKIV